MLLRAGIQSSAAGPGMNALRRHAEELAELDPGHFANATQFGDRTLHDLARVLDGCFGARRRNRRRGRWRRWRHHFALPSPYDVTRLGAECRSQSAWSCVQDCDEVFSNRDNRRTESAVIRRRPATTSLRRLAEIPSRAAASASWRPSGFMNSSSSTSPGAMAGPRQARRLTIVFNAPHADNHYPTEGSPGAMRRERTGDARYGYPAETGNACRPGETVHGDSVAAPACKYAHRRGVILND